MKQRVFVVALVVVALIAGCAPAAAPRSSSGSSPAAAPAQPTAPATGGLAWIGDEAAAFAQARTGDKGVLIDFSATWCLPCVELEHALGTGEARDLIASNFVPLRFDVSEDTDLDAERRARYAVSTLPSVVFIATDGRVVGRISMLPTDADALVQVVRSAIGGLRQGTSAPGR